MAIGANRIKVRFYLPWAEGAAWQVTAMADQAMGDGLVMNEKLREAARKLLGIFDALGKASRTAEKTRSPQDRAAVDQLEAMRKQASKELQAARKPPSGGTPPPEDN